jgi:hypothetical protein
MAKRANTSPWLQIITLGEEQMTVEDALACLMASRTHDADIAEILNKELEQQGFTVSQTAVAVKKSRIKRRLRREALRTSQPTSEPGIPPTGAEGTERTHKSTRLLTPEGVMRELGLNPEEWIVRQFRVNEWAAAASSTKDLESIEGRWSGTVTKPNRNEQYWAYRLTIEPKIVEARVAHIKPIQAAPVEFVARQHTQYQQNTRRTALVWGDPQIGFTGTTPYHDRSALDLIAHLVAAILPHEVICVGDYLDLDCWSDRFAHDPDAVRASQRTLNEGHYWMRRMVDANPQARHIIIEGNHDKRIPNAVQNNLIEAYGLRRVNDKSPFNVMSVPYLMDLESLGIEYQQGYPRNDVWLTDTLRVQHGTAFSSVPGATAAKLLKNATCNVVAGHSHVLETASKTLHTRHSAYPIQAGVVGCTCNIDGTVPGKQPEPQWQQGALLVHYSVDDPALTQFIQIRITNGVAYHNGQTFYADERAVLQEIRTMFPDMTL